MAITDIGKYLAKFGTALASSATVSKLDRAQADLVKHQTELAVEIEASAAAEAAAQKAVDTFASPDEKLKTATAADLASKNVERRRVSIANAERLVAEVTAQAAEENQAANRKATAEEVRRWKVDKETWAKEGLAWLTAGQDILKQGVVIHGADAMGEAVLGANLLNEWPMIWAADATRTDNVIRDVLDGRRAELLPKVTPSATKKVEQTPIVPSLAAFVLNGVGYVEPQTGVYTYASRGNVIRVSADQLASGHRLGLLQPNNPRDPQQAAITASINPNLYVVDPFHCKDVLTGQRCGEQIKTLPSKTPKSSTYGPEQAAQAKFFEPMPGRLSKAPSAAEFSGLRKIAVAGPKKEGTK